MAEDPLNLAPHSVYMPDLSEEELQRRLKADSRKALIDEEMEEARRARLFR